MTDVVSIESNSNSAGGFGEREWFIAMRQHSPCADKARDKKKKENTRARTDFERTTGFGCCVDFYIRRLNHAPLAISILSLRQRCMFLPNWSALLAAAFSASKCAWVCIGLLAIDVDAISVGWWWPPDVDTGGPVVAPITGRLLAEVTSTVWTPISLVCMSHRLFVFQLRDSAFNRVSNCPFKRKK